MKVCKCGCETEISVKKTWVSGHNSRVDKIKKPITKICKICSESFSGRPSYMKDRIICSIKCRNKNNEGFNNPSFKQIITSCPVCDSEFSATPKQIERGKCCSMDCGQKSRGRKISGIRRKGFMYGKNAARRRDNNKCAICEFDSVTAVHHVTPKKHGGTNNLDNLITLCPNHHYMAHAEQFSEEYLRSLIVSYSVEIDLKKPITSRKQKNVVNFRR